VNEEALAHWGAVAPKTNKHVFKISPKHSDTLFYLATPITTSLRLLGGTSGSAVFVAVPICRELQIHAFQFKVLRLVLSF
jgi:hypothetical protein